MSPRNFLAIGECMIEFVRKPGEGWQMGFAGDTMNCAWYFSAKTPLHRWKTAFFTRLGVDAFSDQMTAFFELNGLSGRWITRDPHRQPGLYLIDTCAGERSFSYWRSQSAARLLADDEAHLRKAVADADAIFFSGITLAILTADRRHVLLKVLEEARAAGKTIAFDPNIRERLWEGLEPMREAIMQAAAVSMIALPSFEDEQRFFGDAGPEACAQRYSAAGVEETVVKNGGARMCVASENTFEFIDGMDQVEPLDTTGAGDSFNGTYLAARLSGNEIREAVRQAHELAIRVVRHPGALMPVE